MKKHRSYTAKKYKLARRIIFYAIVAVIIFALTLLLGNHLKSKLEAADTKEPLDLDTTAPVQEEENDGDEESVPHDKALSGVSSGYLDLFGVAEIDDAWARVEALRNKGYNGVSVLITDGEGKLTYQSPAVEEQSRLPADSALVSYDILEAAVSRARNLGMTVTAVMSASLSLSDELVAGELSEIGFDEIIVRGFEEYTELSSDQVAEIVRYVDRIRTASKESVRISVSFAPDFYKSPKNAPYIEKKIFPRTEFLSIDMTGVSVDEAASLCEELAGSFTRFLLRPILSGTDSEAAEAVSAALTEGGIVSRQYISANDENKPADTED